MFQISGLDHIALTVRNQEHSLKWYQRVLGMERRFEEAGGPDDPVFVCAGNACVALFPAETSDPLPVPDQNVLAMRHFAFRLDRSNFERAQVELNEQQIPFRFEDHTIAHSLYLSDPDGHRVELTTYKLSKLLTYNSLNEHCDLPYARAVNLGIPLISKKFPHRI